MGQDKFFTVDSLLAGAFDGAANKMSLKEAGYADLDLTAMADIGGELTVASGVSGSVQTAPRVVDHIGGYARPG